MPLSVADLTTLGDTPVTIRSGAFPNVYLRMDGRGVTSQTVAGGGTVNCQFSANGGSAGPWEKYKVRKQADGTFSFESAAFPNVYLRMDSRGVTSQTAAGGGLVNCQFNANGGSAETFILAMVDQHLDFVMQHQVQGMWCWSAASVSIAAFYNPATAWTQCSLANAELGLNDCCGPAGAASPCNQGRWPHTALQRVGHLNQQLVSALTPTQVGAELANSTPIGLNTAWAGGGGHILVVRGRFLLDGVEFVSVADPWYGDSDVSYDTFRNRYQGSGTWTHTYKTRR
jgi:hypothetical protein